MRSILRKQNKNNKFLKENNKITTWYAQDLRRAEVGQETGAFAVRQCVSEGRLMWDPVTHLDWHRSSVGVSEDLELVSPPPWALTVILEHLFQVLSFSPGSHFQVFWELFPSREQWRIIILISFIDKEVGCDLFYLWQFNIPHK